MFSIIVLNSVGIRLNFDSFFKAEKPSPLSSNRVDQQVSIQELIFFRERKLEFIHFERVSRADTYEIFNFVQFC